MRKFWIGSAALSLGVALLPGIPVGAQTSPTCDLAPGSPATVPEIKPGIWKGYLEKNEMANALALVDGPPAPGSAAEALDQATAKATFALRGTARWTLAAKDADLHFPGVAATFSCALGVPIPPLSAKKSARFDPSTWGPNRRPCNRPMTPLCGRQSACG